VRRSRIVPSPARSPRIVYPLALLLATAAVACGSSGAKRATTTFTLRQEKSATGSACRTGPAPGAAITWVPADLPLPDRTYAVRDVGVSDGVHHGVFATPVPIKEFVRFAVTEWPAKGWRLGRGDSEANEAEDSFARGSEGGSFKVRSDYCDPAWSELNLFYKAQ
jgi:hypothetical protein